MALASRLVVVAMVVVVVAAAAAFATRLLDGLEMKPVRRSADRQLHGRMLTCARSSFSMVSTTWYGSGDAFRKRMKSNAAE